MGKASSWNAEGKGDLWLFDPEALVIVKDKTSSLWDERVHLPLDEALVLSILERGVIEPVVVRMNGDKTEVVDGRQRVRAAIEANKRLDGDRPKIRVPAVGRRGDNMKLLGDMIAANELRRDDGFIVKGKKAQRLLDMGATEDEVARAFGVTKAYLKVMLGSLNLHPEVLKAIENGVIPATSVGKELALLSQEEQVIALEKMKAEGTLSGAKGVEAAKNIRRQKKGATAVTRISPKIQTQVVTHLSNGGGEGMKAIDKSFSDVLCATIEWIGGEKNAFKRWPVLQKAVSEALEPAPKKVKAPKEKKVKGKAV